MAELWFASSYSAKPGPMLSTGKNKVKMKKCSNIMRMNIHMSNIKHCFKKTWHIDCLFINSLSKKTKLKIK